MTIAEETNLTQRGKMNVRAMVKEKEAFEKRRMNRIRRGFTDEPLDEY